jgi:hypothetical protein
MKKQSLQNKTRFQFVTFNRWTKGLFTAIFFLWMPSFFWAQMLETYVGDKRSGVDVIWYKNFKNTKEELTPFKYFSRNRASFDNKNTTPIFGSVNAVSYNLKNGIGAVTVGTFGSQQFVPKLGLQYGKITKDLLLFSWLVTDLKEKGGIDWFLLVRYQPKINEKWKCLLQSEFFTVYNPTTKLTNATQRARMGFKYMAWGAGFMADLNQVGLREFKTTTNFGGFLRYDF